MTNTVSATDLKNRVSDILGEVIFSGSEIIVERYGKPVVKIIPIKKTTKTTADLKKALNRTFGSLPDFPEVTKFRKSGGRKIPPLL